MIIRLQTFSYRFAEQLLNSKLALKQEIEGILRNSSKNLASLSRPNFNKLLDDKFTEKGWESQPSVFDEAGDPSAKMDFMKERLGIEVGFGHAFSSLGKITGLTFQLP